MFNLNSPIINNMQQQGMNMGIQPQGCIPSNPIGNIVSIGNIGYNQQPSQYQQYGQQSYYNQQPSYQYGYQGYNQQPIQYQQYGQQSYYNQQPSYQYNTGNSTYYGGSINNRYNPYYVQQQQTMMAQQNEMMRQQSSIYKTISRAVHKALGQDVDEEWLNKRYDPQFENYNQPQERDRDEDIYNQLTMMQITGREIPYNVECYRLNEGANRYCDEMKRRFPDDMTMAEYHEKAGELLVEAAIEQQNSQQRNLTKLYNTTGYNEMIQRYRKQSSYFNTLIGNNDPNRPRNINPNGELIEDVNVTLPNHLATEMLRRKSAFLNSILN